MFPNDDGCNNEQMAKYFGYFNIHDYNSMVPLEGYNYEIYEFAELVWDTL